jgi:hypothetical protein
MISQTQLGTRTQAGRSSKFVEGSPATGGELLHHTPTSNELFLNILNEMDEFERKRKHRGSSGSADSMVSSNGSPVKDVTRSNMERDAQRSTGFGRASIDAVRATVEEKKSHKIVGRLRALTGGREREEKPTPYPGT